MLSFLLMLLQQDQDDVKKLKEEMEKLKKQVQELKEQDMPWIAKKARQDLAQKKYGIYSKPFLANLGTGTYIGGYVDLEYFDQQEKKSTFDQHRFIPFIYSDITKEIKLATEIEYEHGGTEFSVEFAHIDILLKEQINFRTGLILLPLGKFNLIHDSPINELTNRPLVDTTVIPSTLRDAGTGFWGSFDLDPMKIDYEVYLVNGFKGLANDGTVQIDTTNGLKNARGSSSKIGKKFQDHNDNKGILGRLGIMLTLGVETGFSYYSGKYDERGDNNLSIFSFDSNIQLGSLYRLLESKGLKSDLLRDILFPTEILFEGAFADIDRDSFAEQKKVPEELRGFYLEMNHMFMPEFMKSVLGPIANKESTFTLVYRLDKINLDGNGRYADTIGLNYRLTSHTVFKFEYQFKREFGKTLDIKDNMFVFSFATYF